MEAKKISFGFSKIKKPALAGPSAIGAKQQGKDDGNKVEMISCLEGQAIKIVGKENEDDGPPPLVIPLREQDKTTIPDRLAKLQDIIEGRDTEENGVKKDVEQTPVPVGNESLEQRAAREIMEDLQERKSRANEKDRMVVPLKPEDLPLDGGRASTMDDYESVPIEKFGLAMLRGMGWKEDPNAPKKDDKFPEGPVQRPKGMGLGAERVSKDKNKQLIPPAKDEVLVMKKGAFVKVLAGKHKESYGTYLSPVSNHPLHTLRKEIHQMMMPSEFTKLKLHSDHYIQDHVVSIENQDTLASATWHHLSILYPKELPITEADFVRTWKTILLSRIQDIYEQQKHCRTDDFIRLPCSLNLPAPLADLLYTLGSYYDPIEGIQHHLIPPPRPAEPEPWRTIDNSILAAWSLTINCLAGSFAMKQYPSVSVFEARTPLIHTTVEDVTGVRIVRARFKGPTPEDAYLRMVNDELFVDPYPIADCHYCVCAPQNRNEIIAMYLAKYTT